MGFVEVIDDFDVFGVVFEFLVVECIVVFLEECGEVYCLGGIVIGDDCCFDVECESGVCEGVGECGMLIGICMQLW